MKTQLVCNLILTTAILGAITTPFEGNNKDAMAITLRLPDMTPRVSLRGNVASVTIPKDLMEAALGQTLKINEQNIKDTEFNRVTLKQTNVKIVGDQLEVSGVLQGQHRERIAKVFGKWKHTPWASVKAFTIEAASRPLASQLKLNESSVKTALQKNIGSINAGFNGQSNFIISFTIPALK